VNSRSSVLSLDFERRQVDLGRATQYALSLAYAISIHKSQGSEYPAVVLVLTRGHGSLLSRRLYYTAFTRAKQHLIVVAEWGALSMALGKRAIAHTQRRTRLSRLLRRSDAP